MKPVVGALFLALMLSCVSASHADGFIFTKIADSATPIPGGNGPFTSIPNFSLDQGNVAFKGVGLSGQEGIYLYTESTLSRLADTSTAIPDGIGNFAVFSDVSLDGLDLVFSGGGDNQSGIYTNLGGSLSRLVDRKTSIPDGTGSFEGLHQPSLDNGAVAFLGTSGADQMGVYLAEGGSLVKVADTNTPIPDRPGNFIVFGTTPASLDGGQLTFTGYGDNDPQGYSGIYVSSGGTLAKVADVNTPVPDGVGTFPHFQQPVIDDGMVAFQSYDALNGPGIFRPTQERSPGLTLMWEVV